jgi:hypothetical protein
LLAKDAPFEFDDKCLDAFHILKKALISAPIIQPPDWSLPFEIMCDASDYVVVGTIFGTCQNDQSGLIGRRKVTVYGDGRVPMKINL